ncbi:hypothetical protein EAI_16169 [Harpegnathos saltator]|uniref:Uncharacterized protein n=1 Tax=Harpegnathos saltator TaxID=610380 RepID=E2BH03_HARSA|nr:hypothetical protein EAI_16169 [Harpegnathos saltator]
MRCIKQCDWTVEIDYGPIFGSSHRKAAQERRSQERLETIDAASAASKLRRGIRRARGERSLKRQRRATEKATDDELRDREATTTGQEFAIDNTTSVVIFELTQRLHNAHYVAFRPMSRGREFSKERNARTNHSHSIQYLKTPGECISAGPGFDDDDDDDDDDTTDTSPQTKTGFPADEEWHVVRFVLLRTAEGHDPSGLNYVFGRPYLCIVQMRNSMASRDPVKTNRGCSPRPDENTVETSRDWRFRRNAISKYDVTYDVHHVIQPKRSDLTLNSNLNVSCSNEQFRQQLIFLQRDVKLLLLPLSCLILAVLNYLLLKVFRNLILEPLIDIFRRSIYRGCGIERYVADLTRDDHENTTCRILYHFIDYIVSKHELTTDLNIRLRLENTTLEQFVNCLCGEYL